MEISEILKAVIINPGAVDHEAVLRELTALLVPGIAIDDVKAFCDLKDHETTGGALAGTGSAVFHCLSEKVSETVTGVCVSKKGITRPGQKGAVRIFFIILSPIKESGTHLQMLSRIEALLLDHGFQHALLEARTDDEVKKALKRAEGADRILYMPLEKEAVLSELDTAEKGLSEAEAGRRLKLTGPNTLKQIRKGTLLRDFLSNIFLNLFAILLWAGGLMAFIAGMPELGWAIFLVIVINASFSFWQEYKAERAVEALLKLLPRKVRVLREGAEKEIDASFLVPGDLIKLSEGDSIPADGRLIEAGEMRVDNSVLTGESRPVYKISEPLRNGTGFLWMELPNLVFAGTTVLSGSGTLVVTSTGMDTEIGRVAYLTQAIRSEKSPLQKEIEGLTRTVTMIAVSLGVAFFLLGYLIAGLTFAESFIFAIGIIVANVPEGLLPTVSLSLAMGVQRMAAKKAIVKKLSSVETLGSTTVICTDKTGTLTKNEMCVRKLFVNNCSIDVTGTGYSPDGGFSLNGSPLVRDSLESAGVLELLCAAALCNNASLHPPAAGSAAWTVSGDPTEGALLTAAAKAGIGLEALNGSHMRKAHLPFERVRKRMSTVHEHRGPGGAGLRRSAFVKGAPKEMLSLCVKAWKDGQETELSGPDRDRILEENDSMASKGLRILAVACRTVPQKDSYTASEVERELTFIGLIAMLDPPRDEVRKAVEECRTAGIKVIMITGDYGITARAVADETGIAPEGRVITGEELNSISQGELREILKGEVIFARVAPKDKLRVVSTLQDNGEVVAVTGDGVNDAPALKKADIGVAMGLRGSDVAKESAEIVLADDNFASIVDAIREGRAVYANIKKFVTYIFASNIPEIVPFIAFVIFKVPLPLTVMQILAVDLGTDVFPALGLGVEPPEAGIMKEPPRSRGKRLLDFKTLSRAYLFLGPMEAALSLSGFFFVYWMHGWNPGEPMSGSGTVYMAATTMSFAGIVAAQIGNVFACRTERESFLSAGLFRNKLVIAAIFIELSLLVFLTYTPFLQRLFGFAPLSLAQWAYLSFFPLALIAADEARKAFLRRRLKKT